MENKNTCEVIALGSSYGAYGFNPEFIGKRYFNLCTNSQDLYTASQLLKYMKIKLPNLQKIILFVDIFSRGWSLECSSADHICASYNYLYGFSYTSLFNKNKYLNKCKKIDKKILISKKNENGYLNPQKICCGNTVDDRVSAHLREHDREQSQCNYLKEVLDLTTKSSIETVILIPPVRDDYKALIPKDMLLLELKELVKDVNNVKILYFFDDSDFVWSDFYDYDHLNIYGAEKLCKKLKVIL